MRGKSFLIAAQTSQSVEHVQSRSFSPVALLESGLDKPITCPSPLSDFFASNPGSSDSSPTLSSASTFLTTPTFNSDTTPLSPLQSPITTSAPVPLKYIPLPSILAPSSIENRHVTQTNISTPDSYFSPPGNIDMLNTNPTESINLNFPLNPVAPPITFPQYDMSAIVTQTIQQMLPAILETVVKKQAELPTPPAPLTPPSYAGTPLSQLSSISTISSCIYQRRSYPTINHEEPITSYFEWTGYMREWKEHTEANPANANSWVTSRSLTDTRCTTLC